MTDQSLREALEALCADRESDGGAVPSDYSIDPNEVRDLLTAHPAKPAAVEHGVCNACGWEGDVEHDVCPACGQDELNYFTLASAPARPLAVELHDTYCAAGDWPHAVECVAFEGYEVAANPLLTVLAGRGYARRADVPEVQAEARAPRPDHRQLVWAEMRFRGYTDEEIKTAERQRCSSGTCEWDSNSLRFDCHDENGKSNHPVADELADMAGVIERVLDSDAVMALLNGGAR